MLTHLFKSDESWSGFILRVTLGVVIFGHGAQKLFGWFGGHGFGGTMEFFTTAMNMPALVAFLVILGESVGAIALVAGLLTRFTAASYVIIMLGAIALVHWPYGFYMNWGGSQAGEGFEFHLLAIGMSLALLITGGGKWALDGLIHRWLTERAGTETGRYDARLQHVG